MRNKNIRDTLFKTAINLFYSKGYWDTSIRDIGGKAGVSMSNIYHYFKNKEDLLFEILRTSSQELEQTLLEIERKNSNPVECLQEMLTEHLNLISVERKEESKIMVGDRYWVRGKRKEILRKMQREIYEKYKKKIEEINKMGLLKDIDLTVATFNIFLIVNGFHEWYKEGGRLSKEEVIKNITQFISNAILKN